MKKLKRKIMPLTMLILLLVSAIDFVSISFIAQAASPESGSIDWWFMFRHYENHTGYSLSNVTMPIVLLKNFTTGRAVRSSPAVVDDVAFVGSLNGHVYRWDMNTHFLLPSSTYGAIYSSPAVVEDVVYVGSTDSYVYALKTTDLTEIGKYKTGGPVKSSPVVVEGILYVGSSDGYLYALNATKMTELWKYWTAYPVESSPAVLNDTLYIASKDGKLYAFGGKVHDVAITGIYAPLKVSQNVTIDIAVTMENQGSFDETDINVTAQYYDKIFYNTSINLNRGEERSLLIPWNTTDLEGNYTIHVNAALAPPIQDNETIDNTGYVNIMVEKGLRDIKVADVKLKRIVCQNCTVTIYVTVRNEGNYTEYNINVTAYWSNSTHINQTIGSTTIQKLDPNENQTVNVKWNTTGIAKGDYNISAYATPVQGETNTMDNTLADSWISLRILGDVNGDRIVDITDITMTIAAYGKTSKSTDWYEPKWYVNLDVAPLNGDDKVDISDITTVISQYKKHDC